MVDVRKLQEQTRAAAEIAQQAQYASMLDPLLPVDDTSFAMLELAFKNLLYIKTPEGYVPLNKSWIEWCQKQGILSKIPESVACD